MSFVLADNIDFNSYWFNGLIFILYGVYQFVFYEFYRYYPFAITLLFICIIIIFLPFLFWPSSSFDIYHIFSYLTSSFLILYISFVRIFYFNDDHTQVNQHIFNKLLHRISYNLNIGTHSRQIDHDRIKHHYYNNLTAIIVYLSLFIHIALFILIDIVSNNNVTNAICGLLLLASIPIPNNVILPSYHTAFVQIKAKSKNNFYELLVPLNYGWISLYSLWLICFIFSWTKTCSECQIRCVLLLIIPFMRSLYNKRSDLWFSSYLFGISLMTILSTPISHYFLNSKNIYFDSIDDSNVYKTVMEILSVVNIFYAFLYFVLYIKWIYTQWIGEQKELRQNEAKNFEKTVVEFEQIDLSQIEASRDQTANSYKMNTDRIRNHHLQQPQRQKFGKKDKVKSYSEEDDVVNEMKKFDKNHRKGTEESSSNQQTITPFSGIHSTDDRGHREHVILDTSELNEMPMNDVQLQVQNERRTRQQRVNKKTKKKRVKISSPKIVYNDDNSEKYQAYNENAHYNYADQYT